jgi:hypothetical protein
MKATKQLTSTHQRLVLETINAVEDREIQEEMIALHKKYNQALAGLRLAQEQLKMIDNDCGTDHADILGEINSVIAFVKVSEISLLDMASSMEEAK